MQRIALAQLLSLDGIRTSLPTPDVSGRCRLNGPITFGRVATVPALFVSPGDFDAIAVRFIRPPLKPLVISSVREI